MKTTIALFLLFTGSLTVAQVAAPGGMPDPNTSTQSAPMPLGITQSLPQLDQFSRSAVMNLGRLRVDKWKVDSRDKDQARSNIESLQRNMTSALPSLMQQVRSNPGSLAASVKLYRNLNVLYDVMASITESAGAFGSKDDYNALANDTANLDSVRRSVADDLEAMAANSDNQVSRLAAQLRAQQQAAAAVTAPPKHVIVDDNAPPKKKPATKKKAATPATKPAASTPK
jgi:hypothetical protein